MSMKSKMTTEAMRLVSCKRYDEALDLVRRYKIKDLTVTRITLKQKYGLKPKDIEKLHYIEAPNPHYKCAGNMRLYLRAEAFSYSLEKKRNKTAKTRKQC